MDGIFTSDAVSKAFGATKWWSALGYGGYNQFALPSQFKRCQVEIKSIPGVLR
jgi:hypothetical protein